VVDFYKPFFKPEADEKHYLRVSRAMTLLWGVVLVVIALLAQSVQQSVIELALTIASVPYGSMLGIFLLGVLTRRATGTGAVIGAISGVAVLVGVMAFTPVAWTWYAAIGTVTTFTVGMVVSSSGRKDEV
jgi:Na+/proline symporter